MRIFIYELSRDCSFAWGCAALCFAVALYAVVRLAGSEDALKLDLARTIIEANMTLADSQWKIINAQADMLDRRDRQLMVAGVIPWESGDDG